MDTYLMRAGSSRDFSLLDPAGRTLATLAHPRWWSMAAEGSIGGQRLKLSPEGTWRRNYAVRLDDRPVGRLSTKGLGRLYLELAQADGRTSTLRIRQKSLWRRSFTVELEDGPGLLELQPAFNWRALATDIRARVSGPGIPAEQLPLLLVLAGFGVRLVLARRSAAA
jgi:hypothetical protein